MPAWSMLGLTGFVTSHATEVVHVEPDVMMQSATVIEPEGVRAV